MRIDPVSVFQHAFPSARSWVRVSELVFSAFYRPTVIMNKLDALSRSGRTRKSPTILRDSLIIACSLWGLWLLFVFQLNAKELIAGALAAVITSAILQIIFQVWPLSFAPRLKWFLQMWRLPGMIWRDSIILLRDFLRRIFRQHRHSGYEFIRFNASGDEARAAAQLAFVLVFVSMSPNSVVVHIDPQRARILLHYLAPAPVPKIVGKLQE
jgi:hypothetical protein